ncbi:MAG TPA: SpoIVB peptidase S55 domain-containing protein, partial [Polyangiaceae bacterium]|nr:SpoIVB peptidase S55 domain-containing protein [Polyangiaceae bacterium]
MRGLSLLVAAALGALLAGAPVDLPVARASRTNARPDTMSVDRVRRGMKGYGLTVFEGTTPERFGVEVIDVLKNYMPAQDLILIKTDHPRLDVAKTVAGMSGSPIFIDGKMIGAYSYGWDFGSEPVAGVTPIENMLDELDRPLPREIFGWPLELLPPSRTRPPKAPAAVPKPPLKTRPLSNANRFEGKPGEYRLDRHAAQLAANSPASVAASLHARALSTPLLIGGFGRLATSMAREWFAPLGLEPLAAGGGGLGVEAGSPEHFEDGGSLGIGLVRGDINAMPLGTVTRIEGDRLVAFGHPMMSAGVTALPTAIARVSWVLASEQSSQKIAHAVRPLGALVSDRQASVVVSES